MLDYFLFLLHVITFKVLSVSLGKPLGSWLGLWD